jgi:hypothetical protein
MIYGLNARCVGSTIKKPTIMSSTAPVIKRCCGWTYELPRRPVKARQLHLPSVRFGAPLRRGHSTRRYHEHVLSIAAEVSFAMMES